MGTDEDFFDAPLEQSLVKAKIVEEYFSNWAKVIGGYLQRSGHADKRLGYIDLFAGPGAYKDGTPSTPLLVLQKAIADPFLRDNLVTFFNDKDAKHTTTLQAAIDGLPGVEAMRNQPRVANLDAAELAEAFEPRKHDYPVLVFLDPFGFGAMSSRLIGSTIQAFGSDCLFFFSFNAINRHVCNPKSREQMTAIFGGEEALDALCSQLATAQGATREALIIEALSQAIQAASEQRVYVLPFRFVHANQDRTSHHLVFVSKSTKGAEIMKSIMRREAPKDQDDVVTRFEFCPGVGAETQYLMNFNRAMNELPDAIAAHFAGRTLTRDEVYEEHGFSWGWNFVKKHYNQALGELEKAGRIEVFDRKAGVSVGERKRCTYPERMSITFPVLDD